MEQIKELLTNAGFVVKDVNGQYVSIQDPACIFSTFDMFLDYAWIVVFALTAIMLFGWALLYIKNGVKIDSLFHNAKSLILIFAVLSVIKPAINFVYGNNLFGKLCETKNISMVEVQKLLDMRNKNLNCSKCNNDYMLFEGFDITDSGVVLPSNINAEPVSYNYN